MNNDPAVPKVSIGMPVYNGEQFLKGALDALLGQTFHDFELIISDNASTDGTENICREYAGRYRQISYTRQAVNLGAFANFKFVLDQARGEYFMWAACDDTFSTDFVALNFHFLSQNPDYVASTCPTEFEGQDIEKQNRINFSLDGSPFERIIHFFENCWVSHGMYYSLVRTEVLRGCGLIGQSFIAVDWAIILYLARKGKINRTKTGYATFGIKGASRDADGLKQFRNSAIEVLFPFYRVAQYTASLTDNFPLRQRFKIASKLLRLNLQAAFFPLLYALHSIRRAVRRAMGFPQQ
jgi:glycosyltransferase involved in cell wall biosynthesis